MKNCSDKEKAHEALVHLFNEYCNGFRALRACNWFMAHSGASSDKEKTHEALINMVNRWLSERPNPQLQKRTQQLLKRSGRTSR